jgi:hypothetical protein
MARRRNMTDEERMAEDESLRGKSEADREAKMLKAQGEAKDGRKMLMRYQHKGAFYMDEDTLKSAGPNDVRTKVGSAPTAPPPFRAR